MLKKMIIGAVSSVFCCLAVTLWVVPSVRRAQAAGHPVSSGDGKTDSRTSVTDSRYRLGIHNGYVAVFEGNETQPFLVLDTPIRSLPEPDRTQLELGIPIRTDAELQALLEDYS